MIGTASANKVNSISPTSLGAASMLMRSTNGKLIAAACRRNSELASKIKDESVGHIWNMLATSFEMMVLTSFAQTYDKIESVRVKVRCGLSKSWDQHPLGRPLLRSIFMHLSSVGDLQTLATVICTLGGASAVASLLDDPDKYTPQKIDRVLQR
jgi:hypothetical protein